MIPTRNFFLFFAVCLWQILRRVDGFTLHPLKGDYWKVVDSHMGILTLSSNSDQMVHDENESAPIAVTISHEGKSCEINVFPEETILAALERQSQHLKYHLTALPEMPADCRRGNCLTCAASCSSTRSAAVVVVSDGLSPSMSRLVLDKGYVLTCSSYVTESGLRLQLGGNHRLWTEVYASPGRFTTYDAQLAARSAMARVIRKSAERNVEQWTRETEKVLRKTEAEER